MALQASADLELPAGKCRGFSGGNRVLTQAASVANGMFAVFLMYRYKHLLECVGYEENAHDGACVRCCSGGPQELFTGGKDGCVKVTFSYSIDLTSTVLFSGLGLLEIACIVVALRVQLTFLKRLRVYRCSDGRSRNGLGETTQN